MSDQEISQEQISEAVENTIRELEQEQEVEQELEQQTDALQTLIMQVASLQAKMEELTTQLSSPKLSSEEQNGDAGDQGKQEPELVELEPEPVEAPQARSGLLL